MDLSIIIVSWRSLEDLRVCLKSVYSHTRNLSYEVIVVDNASGDGTESAIRTEFPRVDFIQSLHNLGFAKANNLGYLKSSGDILVFLNPDTEITEDVFARMAAHLRAESRVGAVGARLLNKDGSLQTSCVQAFPTILNQLLDSNALRRMFPNSRLWGMKALFSPSAAPADVEAISGACFVVKRSVFEEIGLFTETYFMYVEDLDLSYKIRRAGHAIHYMPDCSVIHYGGRSSTKQGTSFVSLHQRESLRRFFLSTRGEAYGNCYRAAIGALSALRIVCVVLAAPFLAFRKTDTRSILRKWLANFQWAIGQGSVLPATGGSVAAASPRKAS
jgi:N-acetylglucosaminyl-diphospho-decaprenol L-rhamnosyltransferase